MSMMTHVVFAGVAAQSLNNTGLVCLVTAGEFNSWWSSCSTAEDFHVEAMGVELWAINSSVAMKGEKVGSEDIGAWFDVAWDLDGVPVAICDNVLVGPLLALLVITEFVDLEEINSLRLGICRGPCTEVLMKRTVSKTHDRQI
jgi:hypothetical protein